MPTSTATVRSATTVRKKVAAHTICRRDSAQDRRHVTPFAHVVRHHEEHRRQRRQRNELGQRRRHQQHHQQRQRMNDARDRESWRRCGSWSRCARSRRSPESRRPSATPGWRRPAPSARHWNCACRRSCSRPPPPRAGSPPRPAAPRSSPKAAAAESDRRGTAARWKAGSPVGIPPKRLPMVSTGSLKMTAIAVPASSATIDPGTRFVTRGNNENDGQRHAAHQRGHRVERIPVLRPALHARQKIAGHGRRSSSPGSRESAWKRSAPRSHW